MQFSFIIPVYNRPDETRELLQSLSEMVYDGEYEIVLIEDGSTEKSDAIAQEFSDRLNISYYFKKNSGPGPSRNYGMERATGDYFIILDSDCLLPSHYLTTVDSFLSETYYHCFGGADAAHESFTNLQKAINYVMTSFLTTGGIRGNKKSVQKFEPRSFNMGLSKEAFQKTKGFGKIHPGEDPDLSQRLLKNGFETTFLPDAYVYHKRRISWKKFYAQVTKFGMVRPILNSWHPHAAKPTFWLPTLFVFFTLASIVGCILIHWFLIVPIAIYISLVFLDALIKNRSLLISVLAVIALFVQFFGYGLAFLKSNFYVNLLGRDPKKQFPHLFFD